MKRRKPQGPRHAWTAEETGQLCALLADRKLYRQIAAIIGIDVERIRSRVAQLKRNRDPRLPANRLTQAEASALVNVPKPKPVKVGRERVPTICLDCDKPVEKRSLRCASCAAVARTIPMPRDFRALVAAGGSLRSIGAAKGVSRNTVLRWYAQAGLESPKGNRAKAAEKRAADPGLAKRKAPAARRTGSGFGSVIHLTVDRPGNRDASRAGLAAEYLRKLGPVWRCDEQGRPKPSGTHWRRGSAILTDEEIIGRAERNGWKPDAWREVRAA